MRWNFQKTPQCSVFTPSQSPVSKSTFAQMFHFKHTAYSLTPFSHPYTHKHGISRSFHFYIVYDFHVFSGFFGSFTKSHTHLWLIIHQKTFELKFLKKLLSHCLDHCSRALKTYILIPVLQIIGCVTQN